MTKETKKQDRAARIHKHYLAHREQKLAYAKAYCASHLVVRAAQLRARRAAKREGAG